MAWIASNIYAAVFGQKTPHSSTNTDSMLHSPRNYQPSYLDVLTVKDNLCRQLSLPLELVNLIVDLAEYWPHTSIITDKPVCVTTRTIPDEDRFILRSYPLGYLPTLTDDDQENAAYATRPPRPIAEDPAISRQERDCLPPSWLKRSTPKGGNPCRKIVFTISSHDQGFGGAGNRGTYNGSFTWFEAGREKVIRVENEESQTETQSDPATRSEESYKVNLTRDVWCHLRTVSPGLRRKEQEDDLDRFDFDLLPSMTTIQKNLVASSETREHIVAWYSNDDVIPDSAEAIELERHGQGRDSKNGEFVRSLKLGDVVTVWGKSRFPNWANYVQKVKIDLYWAV